MPFSQKELDNDSRPPSNPTRVKAPLSEGSSTAEHHHLFIKPLTEPFQAVVSAQVSHAERSNAERKQHWTLGERFEWQNIGGGC